MANAAQKAALVAALLASTGGAVFLTHHPDPTLRDVFAACEKGDVSGLACCEDMSKADMLHNMLGTCGQVTPSNHDPFGIRATLETNWDKSSHPHLASMDEVRTISHRAELVTWFNSNLTSKDTPVAK